MTPYESRQGIRARIRDALKDYLGPVSCTYYDAPCCGCCPRPGYTFEPFAPTWEAADLEARNAVRAEEEHAYYTPEAREYLARVIAEMPHWVSDSRESRYGKESVDGRSSLL